LIEKLPQKDVNSQNYWQKAMDQIMEDYHDCVRNLEKAAQNVLPTSADDKIDDDKQNSQMDPFEELAEKIKNLKQLVENVGSFLDNKSYD
jgi:uncharacterized protein YukE